MLMIKLKRNQLSLIIHRYIRLSQLQYLESKVMCNEKIETICTNEDTLNNTCAK